MKNKIKKTKKGLAPSKVEGFTLFVAMIIMGTLLLIASGIINLAVRQAFIATSARESQHAFYAADTGIECVLYWDVQSPSGISAFSTSTGSTITCNGSSFTVGGNPVSTFSLTLAPDPYCVSVTVTKAYISRVLVTTIESKGYNTCDSTNPRRVERAVRAVY